MIFDLHKEPPNCIIEKSTDVCIIGGGTAGIYLAQALHKKNINTILIELGGNSSIDADSAFQKPKFTATHYSGASLGRVAGLGGTSAKWGGQMISLSNSDFLNKNSLNENAAWPINSKDLHKYYEKVLNTLKMNDTKAYSFNNNKTAKLISRSLLGDTFNLRSSSWIPFRKRNFAKNFHSIMKNSKNLEVWINTQFKSMVDAKWIGPSLQSLSFSGKNNRSLVVSSKLFVFTMGALESTRHILPLTKKDSFKGELSTPFCDHISTSVGQLNIKNRAQFLEYFSPFYVGGIMRSMRFELNSVSQDRLMTSSAFVHFISVQKDGSALSIIRNLVRKLQGEKIKFDATHVNLFSILKDMLLIIYWRIFRKKLILNHGGSIEIVIDIEQRPNQINRISSATNNLKLHWRVSEKDKSNVRKTAQAFMSGWSSSKELLDLADVVIYPESELNVANYYDVYHPTGSLPFGNSSDSSVLNQNLRVWETSNLYVSSTAIFPTGGSANPGLTHLALTERLCDHISSKVLTTKTTKD